MKISTIWDPFSRNTVALDEAGAGLIPFLPPALYAANVAVLSNPASLIGVGAGVGRAIGADLGDSVCGGVGGGAASTKSVIIMSSLNLSPRLKSCFHVKGRGRVAESIPAGAALFFSAVSRRIKCNRKH